MFPLRYYYLIKNKDITDTLPVKIPASSNKTIKKILAHFATNIILPHMDD